MNMGQSDLSLENIDVILIYNMIWYDIVNFSPTTD